MFSQNFLTQSLTAFPAEDGFRMPAEWEPHARCWMLWPVREDVWRQEGQPAQRAFQEVAEAIARFEPVTMGVPPIRLEQVRRLLSDAIDVVPLRYDDAWMRDVGPTFVINELGAVRGVDWDFNAWGGVYADYHQDQQVARQVLEQADAPRYVADFILEGGAIHTDGEGTLLAVEECLLNPNRNPQLSQEEIETLLSDYLGVESVIWLPLGVYEDETDGHVDNLCTFVRPGVVALTWTDDEFDPQYPRSQAAFEVLSRAVDARGRRLEIHKIHQPGPLYLSYDEAFGIQRRDGTLVRLPGQRLAASYVNYYVANSGVVVPSFEDPHDEAALSTIQALHPEREVVSVSAREILLGGGSIHCVTQQEPRGATA